MAACPSSDTGPAEKWRRVGVIRWVALALRPALAASCASITCQPLTVVDKQERIRLAFVFDFEPMS